MIICIEYWKGDVYLSGKAVAVTELKRQIQSVQKLLDPIEDNFVPLLCRMYGWEQAEECIPDLTYDRDTSLYF
jgi:hypothetical protein